MRADYDSQGDTLQIQLTPDRTADHGDPTAHPQATVAIRDGRPVAIDITAAASGTRAALTAIAAAYPTLDLGALTAAAAGALAVPDRAVDIDVLAKNAA